MHELTLDTPRDIGAGDILIERSNFQVRLASSHGQRNRSSVLINRMYSWRGYKSSAGGEPAQPDQITLQACRGEKVFGTLTLSFDHGPGLSAAAEYPREIDAYRRPGAKLFELTRLAVDPEHGSKDVLGALFHLAYIHGGLLHGGTDVFIEVNPRHVSFYQRMLHFHQVGECRICERVDALAVLLHLEVTHAAKQIATYGGHRGGKTSSLYPYFFSSEDEQGLPQRMVRKQRPVGHDIDGHAQRAGGP